MTGILNCIKRKCSGIHVLDHLIESASHKRVLFSFGFRNIIYDLQVSQWYVLLTLVCAIPGDCGASYYASILIVSTLVAVAFVPHMALMISWLVSSANLVPIIAPFVYQNPYTLPWWIIGCVCMIPGILAAYSRKYV
jgi:hypothetical protein